MTKWNILITDGLADKGSKILRQKSLVDDLTGITAEQLLEDVGKYDAMIVRSRTKVTPNVFNVASRLKVVGRVGVGVDNIDLCAAKSHNVTVVNSPSATTIAVGEHAFGLMLALARNIPHADSSMKAGHWAKKQLLGSELYGKTLGIIGVGRIGSTIGERASAFGMTILGCDPFLSDKEIQEKNIVPVDLTTVYECSDYISLHVPLTSKTKGMVNSQTFSQMKTGVRLISTARGGVVDEAALLNALQSGKVAGAALDVFHHEPPGPIPLVTHPNVVASPHIGAQTKEAQARAAEDLANEILAALSGQELRWRVV